MTLQWMTSYLPTAPCFRICHPQRTMWRPSRERGPRDVLVGWLAACLVGCGENLAEKGNSRSAPLKTYPRGWGVQAPSLMFGYPTFKAALVSYMLVLIAFRGLEDMLSSSLGQHILNYKPPHDFSIPPFTMYDGSSDPYDSMLHFNQAMILSIGNDRLLCKVFPASLKRPALAWFHKLLRGSINSFNELWAAFFSQYLCSVRQKGNIGSLQTIFKWEDESIRDFTRRFG